MDFCMDVLDIFGHIGKGRKSEEVHFKRCKRLSLNLAKRHFNKSGGYYKVFVWV